jgi:hypothetical protein
MIENFKFLKQNMNSEPWIEYSSLDNSIVSDKYFIDENQGFLGFIND